MNLRRISLFAAVVALCYGLCAPAFAQDWIIRFRPGDTFWDLCIKYSNKRGCWIELGKYNNIANDRTIPPGTEIRFPSAWLTTMPVVGQVEYVRGDVVYYERSRGAGNALVAGQSLLLGSRIVARQGTAQIVLGGDSAVLLRPDSELNLDSLSSGSATGQSAELSLDAGDVEVEVKSGAETRFEIKTPAAIAAVRGTHYRVSSLAGASAATRSEVLSGAVEVSGGGVTLVPAGYGLLARKGEPQEEPRELLPPPVFERKRVDAPLPLDIRWQADPAAVSWQVDLLLGEKGDELAETYALSTPKISLTELDEASCYRLVLRAVDTDGFNGMESELPVCVVARLPAPSDISIDRIEEGRYQVAWSPVAGASQYRLEIGTDEEFGTLISSQVVTAPQAEVAIVDVDRFNVRANAIDDHANMGEPSETAEYIEPDYLLPAVLTFLFLLLTLV